MNSHLSLAGSPQLQAPPPPAQHAPTRGVAAAVPRPEGPSAAPVPKKAELQFDAEEMQQNLQQAIERINEQMRHNGRNLNFSVDEVIDRTIITVKNRQSGEVVRQIPDEVLVRVAHNIEDIKGLLLNEKI